MLHRPVLSTSRLDDVHGVRRRQVFYLFRLLGLLELRGGQVLTRRVLFGIDVVLELPGWPILISGRLGMH